MGRNRSPWRRLRRRASAIHTARSGQAPRRPVGPRARPAREARPGGFGSAVPVSSFPARVTQPRSIAPRTPGRSPGHRGGVGRRMRERLVALHTGGSRPRRDVISVCAGEGDPLPGVGVDEGGRRIRSRRRGVDEQDPAPVRRGMGRAGGDPGLRPHRPRPAPRGSAVLLGPAVRSRAMVRPQPTTRAPRARSSRRATRRVARTVLGSRRYDHDARVGDSRPLAVSTSTCWESGAPLLRCWCSHG